MKICYIKLSFKEQRLFVQTADCGVFVTLTHEPEIVSVLPKDVKANEIYILQQQEDSCCYELYLAVKNLDEKYIQNALQLFRQHYPDGYIAIQNDFLAIPNAIRSNLQTAIAATKIKLEQTWGAISITAFGLFSPHLALPLEMKNEILSKIKSKAYWQNDHLVSESLLQHDQYLTELIDDMTKFTHEHYKALKN